MSKSCKEHLVAYPIYQVDAFTDRTFGGNPACVIPLEEWLPDSVLLAIAKENAVAETAYFTTTEDGFALRWFTPEYEIDLCGHATLATAHVIFNHLGYTGSTLNFSSISGVLSVEKHDDWLMLDFPSRKPCEAELPKKIAEGLNIHPLEVYKARDYVLLYGSEEDIRSLAPNKSLVDRVNIDPGGFVATAVGKDVDFVSRFFTPQASIFEDPVTGSAHCSLIPFWAERLGKTTMKAAQLSERGGELLCELKGDRVFIKGKASTYLQGSVFVPQY